MKFTSLFNFFFIHQLYTSNVDIRYSLFKEDVDSVVELIKNKIASIEASNKIKKQEKGSPLGI